MTDDLNELKQASRGIEAPPHVATRIRAAVADRSHRPRYWIPSAISAAAAVAIVMFLQNIPEPESIDEKTLKPSLSALASLKPEKPANVDTSLTRLRSVQLPPMPAKPKPAKPQSRFRNDHELTKETDHALI